MEHSGGTRTATPRRGRVCAKEEEGAWSGRRSCGGSATTAGAPRTWRSAWGSWARWRA